MDPCLCCLRIEQFMVILLMFSRGFLKRVLVILVFEIFPLKFSAELDHFMAPMNSA